MPGREVEGSTVPREAGRDAAQRALGAWRAGPILAKILASPGKKEGAPYDQVIAIGVHVLNL